MERRSCQVFLCFFATITQQNQVFDITFEKVQFAYEEGHDVLKDITFEIPQGTTLGILGGSGSGKSTITQLLTRFYELGNEDGFIKIGGRDIREIPLEDLRRQVGVVLQEPFLYSRTIKENIASANPNATMEEIRNAAKIACVDEAIMNFPDGYDTLVGERGVTLSGGQRQRVAIARMLLQKAPIMIFDDLLSAVDSETDSLIRKALKEHMQDATVILVSHRITTLMAASKIMVLHQGHISFVIAHRLSTIRNADVILVVKDGKIIEQGSHKELLAQKGYYHDLYYKQFEEESAMKVFAGE